MFRKHLSLMSELFGESMDTFMECRGNLILKPVPQEYLASRAHIFRGAVKNKRRRFNELRGVYRRVRVRRCTPIWSHAAGSGLQWAQAEACAKVSGD